MSHPKASKKGASQRVVMLLAALFAMPVAVAAGLYFSGWRPAPAAAHGTLVQPPQPVAEAVLGEANGKRISLNDFRERWTLLYFGPAACPATCQRTLFALRQVHLALGREQERLQRVFAARGALSPETSASLLRDFPGTGLVASTDDADRSGWPKQWAREGQILLIDPQGNLVMTYAADADPSGIRKDLARLLAYSWVG